MNHYTIKVHNKKNNAWQEKVVEKLTFSEAVIVANNTKCLLGHAWEIISIHRDLKEKENA